MRSASTVARLALFAAALLAMLALASCGGSSTEQAAESMASADSAASVPGPEDMTGPPPVFALSSFDPAQGSTIAGQWKDLSSALSQLHGFRAIRLFLTMDWESEQQAVVLGMWDSPDDAHHATEVAASRAPARGWTHTTTYRTWAVDGDMRDSLFRSVVIVVPMPASTDSATAVQHWNSVNAFVKTQPGYIASVLGGRVAGDAGTGAVVMTRWATRDAARAVQAHPEFQKLRSGEVASGKPTVYLEIGE